MNDLQPVVLWPMHRLWLQSILHPWLLPVTSMTKKPLKIWLLNTTLPSGIYVKYTTDRKGLRAYNVVNSLIPYIYHAKVIKAAVKHKKNVVTTSYVSPAMMEYDEA